MYPKKSSSDAELGLWPDIVNDKSTTRGFVRLVNHVGRGSGQEFLPVLPKGVVQQVHVDGSAFSYQLPENCEVAWRSNEAKPGVYWGVPQ